MTATLPNGRRQDLGRIPDWKFNWQERYYFNEFIRLPKGTRLDVQITYDNSTGNISNPSNPPKRVTFGEQSTDEMGSMTIEFVPVNAKDLPTFTAAVQQHVQDAGHWFAHAAASPAAVRRQDTGKWDARRARTCGMCARPSLARRRCARKTREVATIGTGGVVVQTRTEYLNNQPGFFFESATPPGQEGRCPIPQFMLKEGSLRVPDFEISGIVRRMKTSRTSPCECVHSMALLLLAGIAIAQAPRGSDAASLAARAPAFGRHRRDTNAVARLRPSAGFARSGWLLPALRKRRRMGWRIWLRGRPG